MEQVNFADAKNGLFIMQKGVFTVRFTTSAKPKKEFSLPFPELS